MSENGKDSMRNIDQLLSDVGNLSDTTKVSDDDVNKTVTEAVTESAVTEEAVTATADVKNAEAPVKEQFTPEPTVQTEDDGEKPVKKKKGLVIGITIVAVVLLALGGIYAFLSMPLSEAKKQELYANGTFIQGVSVFDVDVSGETIESAKKKLDGKINLSKDDVLMELKLKDTVIPVKASDLSLGNTMDSVLKEAMLFGRDGHLIKRLLDRSEAQKNGKQFDVAIYTDDKNLDELVKTIVKNYSVEAKDADVQINENGGEKFTFIQEQVGMEISPNGLSEKIKNHIEKKETGYIQLEYNETQPKITMEELKKNMVLRSSYSTNVSGATGRRKNIMLAASKINKKKVMPGEEFNIEQELGTRSAANGWSVGGEFVNGELVNGYGGGICQASSTLFNAVIRADLEVVKRSNHSQTVGYVPLGFDATISSGGPYFIWKNNTKYPIYIFASATMSKITIELYGAPLPYGDNITYDEVVSASGTVTSGRRVQSALVFYQNGKEVHRISWSSAYRGKPVKVTTKATTQATTGTTATTAATTTKAPTTTKTPTQTAATTKPKTPPVTP